MNHDHYIFLLNATRAQRRFIKAALRTMQHCGFGQTEAWTMILDSFVRRMRAVESDRNTKLVERLR